MVNPFRVNVDFTEKWLQFCCHKNIQNYIIGKNHMPIWNQNRKCIKMSINKPMFGLVVLEIACDIFVN